MLEKAMFMIFITAVIILFAYLDKKFQLGLSGELTTEPDARDEPEYQDMRKRIETLEKIVTEPSYQLNKDIEELSKR